MAISEGFLEQRHIWQAGGWTTDTKAVIYSLGSNLRSLLLPEGFPPGTRGMTDDQTCSFLRSLNETHREVTHNRAEQEQRSTERKVRRSHDREGGRKDVIGDRGGRPHLVREVGPRTLRCEQGTPGRLLLGHLREDKMLQRKPLSPPDRGNNLPVVQLLIPLRDFFYEKHDAQREPKCISVSWKPKELHTDLRWNSMTAFL